MGYDNKPDNTCDDYYHAETFPEDSSLQRGGNVPYYREPVLQRVYGLGKQSCIPRRYCFSRMTPRKSIKGGTNKQIAISSPNS